MRAMVQALVVLAVALASATQRVTGMGFALVAGPLLVLLLGPRDGVLTIQAVGVVLSALVLARVWRDVEWRTAGLLVVASAFGMVPGAWLAGHLEANRLQLLVGVLILVALTAIVASQRARVFTGTAGALSAGAISGFMNVTAGVGGPAIVLRKESIGWAQRPFVATVQVYFVVLSAGTLVLRGLPAVASATWVGVFAAMSVGLVLGSWLARRVSEERARLLVLVVAYAGALATVAKAAWQMWA